MDNTMLTISEVAAHYRVSRLTVYRWIHKGKLKAVKVGQQYRVTKDELDAFEQ